MGRLGFRLLGMGRTGRKLADGRIDEETDTEKDEWDAEPLPHVEKHILLELHLRVLDELDEEAGTETADEEPTDEEAAVHLVQFLFVDEDEDDAEDEVAESLVELGRMAGKAFGMLSARPVELHPLVGAWEAKSPRKVGRAAENFGIEEISQTYKRPGETYCNGEPVHNPHEVEVVLPAELVRKPYHRDNQSDCSAVTRETALPRHENLREARPRAEVIVRLIEEAVSQTRPDNRGNQQSVKQIVQKRTDLNPLVFEKMSEYVPTDDESRNEENRIVPD